MFRTFFRQPFRKVKEKTGEALPCFFIPQRPKSVFICAVVCIDSLRSLSCMYHHRTKV